MMDGQYFELGLADALGSVRAEIAALKDREQHLRAAILASPRRETGREFDVFIRRTTSRRLNRAALPDAILSDPRYWTETVTETVLTRARNGPPRRSFDQPGPAGHMSRRTEPEDNDVMEDM